MKVHAIHVKNAEDAVEKVRYWLTDGWKRLYQNTGEAGTHVSVNSIEKMEIFDSNETDQVGTMLLVYHQLIKPQ